MHSIQPNKQNHGNKQQQNKLCEGVLTPGCQPCGPCTLNSTNFSLPKLLIMSSSSRTCQSAASASGRSLAAVLFLVVFDGVFNSLVAISACAYDYEYFKKHSFLCLNMKKIMSAFLICFVQSAINVPKRRMIAKENEKQH